MKVTGVTTTVYRYARGVGDADSVPGRTLATACLVELMTDEEITGVGLGGERSRREVERLVRTVLLGKDPRRVTGLWQLMVNADASRGADGLTGEAMAVLDMALWDLKARANNEPLWRTLGGARPRANAYASDAGLPLGDDALFCWYRRMAADYGFRSGKVKVGLDQEADLRRLGLMRDALGSQCGEPVLMIDADECWSPKQAVRKVRDMEVAYDLTWVEAPAPCRDFQALKHVSNSVRAAVCAGKYFCSHADFLPHWRHRSLDIVQLDPARTGVTVALQLADTAYGYEMPVTLAASPGNIHAHLAGAMPYFMSLEVIDPHPPEGLFTTDVRVEGGRAVAGDRPGNGLLVDYDALSAARTEVLPDAVYRRAVVGPLETPPRDGEGVALATSARDRT